MGLGDSTKVEVPDPKRQRLEEEENWKVDEGKAKSVVGASKKENKFGKEEFVIEVEDGLEFLLDDLPGEGKLIYNLGKTGEKSILSETCRCKGGISFRNTVDSELSGRRQGKEEEVHYFQSEDTLMDEEEARKQEAEGLDSKAAEDLDSKQQRMDEETMGTGEESWKEDEEEDLASFFERGRQAAVRDKVFSEYRPEVYDRWMTEFGYKYPCFNQTEPEARHDMFSESDEENLPAEESSSEDDDDLIVQDEEEEEEEPDWKKGKTKEEQLQFLIDTYQNKHFFKSDEDDLSEDEDGYHEMTYQEFVRYTFELEESGGFDIGSYPNVFAFGMIKPYYEASREKDKDKLGQLTLFANKALDKYNNKKGSHFKNVRVLKANTRLVAGLLYYITFEAFDDGGARTFQAKVLDGIPRAGTPRVKVVLIRPSRGNNR